jgi:hypothetical protein
MQQLKLFKGVENDLAGLESEVNAWIRQTGAKIVAMTGNIAPQSEQADAGGTSLSKTYPPSDVIIIVLYVPGKKAESEAQA